MTNSTTMSYFSLNNPRMQQVITLLFVISTTILFVYLNKVQPKFYIDEAFHLPQAQRYCNGSFFEWDSKITTLPGLYLLAAAILGPFKLCTTIFLRSINLIGTFLNLYLSYKIIKSSPWAEKSKDTTDNWMPLAVSLSITLLPPLFFWHFLFYTDVIATNLVLLMIMLHQKQWFTTSAVVGVLTVLMRQTNIIWVVLLAGERVLTLIEAQTPQSIAALQARGLQGTSIHARLLWNNVLHHFRRGFHASLTFAKELCGNLLPQIAVIVAFLAFVVLNKGIVIGDRSAHVPTVHLPQIFYFSVFTMAFTWPYMMPHCKSFFQAIRKHWVISSALIAVMTVIVHNNTLVHPYLMADNRHYVFYIWSKFMGKYLIARYLLIPIYAFAIYSITASLYDVRFLSKILHFGSIFVVLVPQLLLEPRYFIIPYILLRLNMPQPKRWQIFAELSTNLIINFLQFYIFSVKTFYWTDQEGPQRLSW